MKKKKICVVTATRAEYGLLRPLILRLLAEEAWELQLVVTGMHLSEAFGNTYKEIEQDRMPVFAKIPILEPGDDAYAATCTMANAMRGFGAYFAEQKPDLLLILGDRTEMLAIAAAAMNAKVPIGHLHGGELTQGAVDDCVRHAITKMSSLHFAAAQEYRRRIIQMGEEPARVFFVGALGVENILKEKLLSREELTRDLGSFVSGDYAVVTFHPVTLEEDGSEKQLKELIAAMSQRRELFYLVTKANGDAGGRAINRLWEQETAKYDHMMLVDSLGMKRYLSALKYARLVLGNSSSGILEAPSLGIPTVNIGDRQRGRLMAKSVLQCPPCQGDIVQAIDRALAMEVQAYDNPYGDGTASQQITSILKEQLKGPGICLKKNFYDL